ncbi:MAG: flavodoxin [Firmicutes bacterium]|nr:flavodoxin [Bacillota bacterium]
MSKILVVYYSFEGTTELVANSIAKLTNGDLLNIKPVNELKSKGFSKYFWGGSQVFMKKSPSLIDFDLDINLYDTIFIGTPIWAGTYAPPIKSFFAIDDLKGKQIYFFYTHDGGPGKVEKHAKAAIEVNNMFAGTLGLLSVKKNLESNMEIIKSWISSLNL